MVDLVCNLYEMSREDSSDSGVTWAQSTSIGNVATESTIRMVSKPSVKSWRAINISNCYENSLVYDSSKNSHLMKNSEWGAVAYLTHSKYGRNGNQIEVNACTGYYTGAGPTAVADSSTYAYDASTFTTTYAYNTTLGKLASSAGNISGIYDLSGCAFEYVAAFNDAYSSTGSYYSKTSSSYKSASGNNMGATGLANGGSTRYLTAYSNGTAQYYIGQSSGNAYTSHIDFAANGYTVSITGDAISEVWVSSSSAWFNDSSSFLNSTYPFMNRGGYYYSTSTGGVFGTNYCNFDRYQTEGSFRVCLAQDSIQDYCNHTYSDWVTVKGACVEDGLQKRICSQCGYTEINTISAIGEHVYGSWETVTEATCAERGREKVTCTVCGEETTRTIEYSRTHNFVDDTCKLCGLNYPQMTSDMEPVAWTSDGTTFTPTTDEEWFDYLNQLEGVDGTSNWANAKTSDGSYWVWVPRYEYKITSQPASSSEAGTIDVRFIPTTTNSDTSGYTTTTAVNQTVNGVSVLSKGITVSSDGYIIHPAFTSDADIGGWDSELAGIWVAKYEMSMETSGAATTTSSATIGNVATSSTIKAVSKPSVTSWRYINISNMYENSLAYDSSKNSHLMKNSEWGAVAYLTYSKYGRNGNKIDRNSCTGFYTGAGPSSAGSTSTYAYDASTFATTYAYNTTLGKRASSTGNISGIYDLAGCTYEYVAAFNDGYSSSGSSYSKTSSSVKSASGNNMGATGLANGGSTAYLTAYSNGTSQYYIGQSSGNAYTSYTDFAANGYTVSITGDAVSEVCGSGSKAWFSDSLYFTSTANPFLERGGRAGGSGSGPGVLTSNVTSGVGTANISFRVCLADPQEQPIGTDQSYVGCYADMDRDGTIDGVIFADQGYGPVEDGKWNEDDWATYEIPKITSGLKEYEITQESYTIQSTDGKWDSNAHPVISPVEGTSGADRFYVMKLSDFTTSSYSTFYWYNSGYGKLDDTIGTSESDSGEGYEKTGEMITRWNNRTYGAQNARDIWGLIQDEYANGWFVPSKGEWSAFGGELGITSSNYSSTYGLSYDYWSSSQYDTGSAYYANFFGGDMGLDDVDISYCVRLCATF